MVLGLTMQEKFERPGGGVDADIKGLDCTADGRPRCVLRYSLPHGIMGACEWPPRVRSAWAALTACLCGVGALAVVIYTVPRTLSTPCLHSLLLTC